VGKVINTTSMTVDGVIDVGEWYITEGDHDRAALDQFKGAEAMLTGRTTYEGFAGFWPQQTGEWADVLNPLPKYVASRTVEGPLEWNATAIAGDAAESVSGLKGDLAGDLILSGCGELARHLIENGVVDELWFWVHPVVWGEGARPYQGATVRMRHLGSTPYDSGVTLLRYEPARA
jgi:dihydrofolate reductase